MYIKGRRAIFGEMEKIFFVSVSQQKRQFSTEGCRFSFKAKICFVNVSQIRKPMLIQGRLSFFAKKALNFETAEKVNKH